MARFLRPAADPGAGSISQTLRPPKRRHADLDGRVGGGDGTWRRSPASLCTGRPRTVDRTPNDAGTGGDEAPFGGAVRRPRRRHRPGTHRAGDADGQPTRDHVHLASDEGALHDGDAPPPPAVFVAGLSGCLMAQIRAVAKRMDVRGDWPQGPTSVVWDGAKAGPVHETAPKRFDIDVDLDSPDPKDRVIALIHAAKKGCFLDQTLSRPNTLHHRLPLRSGAALSGAYPSCTGCPGHLRLSVRLVCGMCHYS